MIPKKRIYQLATEQALQNWKDLYNKLQSGPKDIELANHERLAQEEYIEVLKAKEDFERVGK